MHEYMCMIGGASGGLAGACIKKPADKSPPFKLSLSTPSTHHQRSSHQLPFRLTPGLENTEVPEPRGLDAAQLSRCLPRLTVRERSVLVFSFFADKPADEVAAELGLEAGNTRVIRHRALLKLRECMSRKDFSA